MFKLVLEVDLPTAQSAASLADELEAVVDGGEAYFWCVHCDGKTVSDSVVAASCREDAEIPVGVVWC